MNTLAQKDGRNSKYFEIQEDGVFVKNNFAKEINEYKVYFSDIQDDETVFRKKKDPVLIGIVISMVFNSILVTIFINDSYQLSYSIGMIVFVIALFPTLIVGGICNNEFRKENSKSLTASKPIIFSYAKKEMEEVNSFITKIKESKKDYYLREYYKVDNLIPTHVQISRIHWLYESKYINESDAKFILDEIDSKRIIEGL
ncbi:hypothetical protein A0O34_18795 [Chryseobacterium glaciei]|uniref:Uncharacterized protein n=1 Tax=Chryseobacterium glaciei TaxID=1685010 RepID=A0A172XZS3_9FLAO|nr:hypothetical protein [Chryseobacterium glaciei]ANF52441.1 hypothetical protein A0O34_18795 [Chryseobacterium glaciei]